MSINRSAKDTLPTVDRIAIHAQQGSSFRGGDVNTKMCNYFSNLVWRYFHV